MKRYSIKLAEDTISEKELSDLADWIKTGARLTKGELTKEFEKVFADYIGTKYSVFVNSGSSANLLMAYALLESETLKNKNVIVPAVSWITTLSPFLQLGFKPFLCDSDIENLGVDLNHFEDLCKKHHPSVAIIVHVLGHPNRMNELNEICGKYNVALLEDACEALGTILNGKKLGSFGKAASFSFYYGHHISTIEGGMVTTDDHKLYNLMLSIRSHGWSRDVEQNVKDFWLKEYDIDEFRELYTFYYAGFNLRSSDLNAFLGISQLKRINDIVNIRERNYNLYKNKLSSKFYSQSNESDVLSNFAFGTFVKNRIEVFKFLKNSEIETRPLICGSMGRQPFWIKNFGELHMPVADLVHDNGIYLPNNLKINKDKIEYISEKFLEIAEPIFLDKILG